MSAKIKMHPSKLRTFAGDLSEERKRLKLSTDKDVDADRKEVVNKQTLPKNKKLLQEAINEIEKPIEKVPEKIVQKGPSIIVSDKEKNVGKRQIIPAYHELQKHQAKPADDNTIQTLDDGPKKTVEKKTNKPNKLNIGYDATVITDTKKNSFKLLPSIIKSVKEWSHKQAVERKKRKSPKYFVAETSHRKGVIQQATSKTGTSFTADNETLKEQIRRRQQNNSEISEYDINWSPFTEPGYELLGAEDQTSNVTVEYKKQSTAPTTIAKVPTPVIKRKIEEPVFVEPTNESFIEPAPVAKWGMDYHETSIPESTPAEPEFEETTIDVSYDDNEEVIQVTKKNKRSVSFANLTDTNTMTLLLLLVILVLLTLGFIGRMVINHLNNNEAESAVNRLPSETLVPDIEITYVTISPDNLIQLQLSTLISESINSSQQEMAELAIVSPAGNEVSASYIFELLDFNMLKNLQQSITTARFVSVNKSDPALVLQFVDKETVRGGLLQWEETIADDLQILYHKSPESINSVFTDDQINDSDVRVLLHEGETVLIYGIIDENTALIAPNHTIFSKILEKKLQQ